MCDWDDFEDDGFMDEDSFEDHFNDQIDDPDNDMSGDEHEPDGFDATDAFSSGSIIGNAYEEALDERKRRELLRKKRIKRDPEFE